MTANSTQLSQHRIRLQESTQRRMIMAALEVIQLYGVIIQIGSGLDRSTLIKK